MNADTLLAELIKLARTTPESVAEVWVGITGSHICVQVTSHHHHVEVDHDVCTKDEGISPNLRPLWPRPAPYSGSLVITYNFRPSGKPRWTASSIPPLTVRAG